MVKKKISLTPNERQKKQRNSLSPFEIEQNRIKNSQAKAISRNKLKLEKATKTLATVADVGLRRSNRIRNKHNDNFQCNPIEIEVTKIEIENNIEIEENIVDINFDGIPNYFETQAGYLCGKHSINNLLQFEHFTSDMLFDFAHIRYRMALDEYRVTAYNRSIADYCCHDSSRYGNFSTDVLEAAICSLGYLVEPLNHNTVESLVYFLDPIMFLITTPGHHFSARRLLQMVIFGYLIRSIQVRPEIVSK